MLHVGKFYQNTIKLNDSYQVLVEFPGSHTSTELVNCIGFSIPKIYEWKEEVHNYGNMSQKFLIPKVDILPTLTIELLEYINDNNLVVRNFLSNINAESRRISYSDLYSISEKYTAKYNLNNKDLDSLTIKILSNDLSNCVYAYYFTKLTVIKAEPYEFSYEDDSICKWTISFIFNEMEKINSPDDNMTQI